MIGTETKQRVEVGQLAGVVPAAQLAERATGLANARKVLGGIRAFSVTIGPSALFDLFLGASAVATVTGRLGRQPPTRRGGIVRAAIAVGDVMLAGYVLALRPWMRGWGATKEEKWKGLPGDDLVLNPWTSSTRAITVDAPVAEVWPWIAQMGQDRGGFYSYEWIENLAGCKMRNADRIHPEWQVRNPGDVVRLHPATGCEVTVFDPKHAMVLKGWGAFVVERAGARSTRVILRTRTAGLAAALYDVLVIELPRFLMERRMLKGIKQRAERAGDGCGGRSS